MFIFKCLECNTEIEVEDKDANEIICFIPIYGYTRIAYTYCKECDRYTYYFEYKED